MGKKILLVEDDKFLLKFFAARLKEEDFEVILAEDGEEAVRKVKEEKPDLILLDLILPKKDGFAVLKEIKSDEKTKNIPVFVLSNLGQESDREKAKELGAVDYLVKVNFDLKEIIKKIKNYFNSKG